MENFDIGKLLREYDEAEVTSAEVASKTFEYLRSHRDDIDTVLPKLQNHSEESINRLVDRLVKLLNSGPKDQSHGTGVDP